jgi:5-methylcytosine-specific restriction endonuclease McrA
MKREYLPYDELKDKKSSDEISYEDLLFTTEWEAKRKEVISRDKWRCQECNNIATMYALDGTSKKYYQLGEDVKTDIFDDDGNFTERTILPKTIKQTDRPYHMHVHHTFYILGNLPWEYDNKDLITLCHGCHKDFHKNNKVPYYQRIDNELQEIDYNPCERCNGSKYFSEYSHVKGGICFGCNGLGYDKISLLK